MASRFGSAAGAFDAAFAHIRWNARALDELLKGRDGPVADEILRRAVQVEARAKRLCPVDTGRLRASITHAVGKDDDGVYAVVGSTVEYAIFIEFGHSKQAPQGYLRPALEAVAGRG